MTLLEEYAKFKTAEEKLAERLVKGKNFNRKSKGAQMRALRGYGYNKLTKRVELLYEYKGF